MDGYNIFFEGSNMERASRISSYRASRMEQNGWKIDHRKIDSPSFFVTYLER